MRKPGPLDQHLVVECGPQTLLETPTPEDPKECRPRRRRVQGRGGAGKLRQLEAEGAVPTPAAAAPKVCEGGPSLEGSSSAVLGPSHAQLVQEATEVLGLSLSEGYGLLDSGATSALHQDSAEEISQSTPVEVQLAVGSASMHVNVQGTLLTQGKVQPILPMAALPRLGCVIQWSEVGFSVKHPVLGLLPTRLNCTSPELPAPLLLKLITDYEGLVTREARARG